MTEIHPEADTPREHEADDAVAERAADQAREAGTPVVEAGAEDEGRLSEDEADDETGDEDEDPLEPAGTVTAEDAQDDADDAIDTDPEVDGVPAKDPAERLKELEEEGDIAADYLEELLDIADFDGDIDIDVDGDRASVEIRGATQLARINEPRGELLDALQELARLAVQTKTGNRSRLMLDIGGFRAQHKGSLEELAEAAVARANEEGQPQPLRPMNPFERKVVHDVAKQAGLRSESDGDGKNRHVVIYPAS